MFGIKNPINPSTTFTADITTRDSVRNLIGGPSQTNVYTIKKVDSSDLADSSVISTKPAESFMKKVTLLDNAAGNAAGWTPDAFLNGFNIFDPAVSQSGTTLISITVDTDSHVTANFDGAFSIVCDSPPPEDSILDYVVINLPAHVS